MKSLYTILFLSSCVLAVGQDSSDLFDKAPPAIDEALRARLGQFYQAHVLGKFKDAFALVAEDAQDDFLGASKSKYKSCEVLKITYLEEFTKADVIEGCQAEVTFHGKSFLTRMPLPSSWKVVDGQWFWYYVKPKFVPTPFSPTGFAPAQDEVPGMSTGKLPIPSDPTLFVQGVLQKIKLDKTTVQLRSDEDSRDEVHIKNEMPGSITLNMDKLVQPGLKITLAKTQLESNEEATIVFEYTLTDKTIACIDCANHLRGTLTAQLHVEPTAQLFPITINIAPKTKSDTPAAKK